MNPRRDPRCPRVQPATPNTAKLPDPWLFDSEALLRELDRCREKVLEIPINGDSNTNGANVLLRFVPQFASFLSTKSTDSFIGDGEI